ncbi:MAG: putative oxidoreductase yvaA [Bacteroidota bacterium]|jgi:predicted dehydrogenase
MKVLIIGLGSIAKKHIAALQQIDLAIQIIALRSASAFEEVGNVKSIINHNEIPTDVDFVIISNPTSEHYKTIKQFSAKNIPLFIEKPLFHQLEIIDFITSTTYVACNLRFHPCIVWLKNNIEKLGRINEVNIYCGSYLPDWRKGIDFRKNYSSQPEMGGGAHLDLIHELDYCFYLFGKPTSSHKLLKSNSSLKIDAIDYANYQLEYENFVANITLNYFRKDTKRQIEIVAENETWVIDLIENKIMKSTETIEKYEVQPMFTYVEQMKYFIDCLKQNEKPMNDLQEANEVLKICLG